MNSLFHLICFKLRRQREKETHREKISKSLDYMTHRSPLFLDVFLPTARTEKTKISTDSAFYTVGYASWKEVRKLSGCLYIKRIIIIQYVLLM